MTKDSDDYTPLHHPNQQAALPNHVVMLYTDHDAQKYKEKKSATITACVLSMLGIVLIASGLGFLVFGGSAWPIGLFFIVPGIPPSVLGKAWWSNRNEIDPNKAYSYYCYDISSQSVKCVIVNKKTKQIDSEPSNLGYINDIREIQYDNGGTSDSSFVEATNEKGDLLAREMLTFNFSKKKFCRVFTEKIHQIKSMGLNDIQLQYQQIYGTGLNSINAIENNSRNNNEIINNNNNNKSTKDQRLAASMAESLGMTETNGNNQEEGENGDNNNNKMYDIGYDEGAAAPPAYNNNDKNNDGNVAVDMVAPSASAPPAYN